MPRAQGCAGAADVEHSLQALGPSHRGPAFGGGAVFWLVECFGLAALATLGRCHPRAVFAVGGEHAVEARQVDPWLRHQGGQSCEEVEGLEDDMGGAVAIGGFQLIVLGKGLLISQ